MALSHASPFNRKQRKALARRLQSADPGLEVVHPNAAGVDQIVANILPKAEEFVARLRARRGS